MPNSKHFLLLIYYLPTFASPFKGLSKTFEFWEFFPGKTGGNV